ncbi:MAG: hypothetical protein IJS59_02500 [Bacteroidaceae bacterium]|nr:hypothetical protein [Bacteroidaceae bacterium]
MKKTLLTLATALCAASASADDYSYFVLQQTDGTCTPLTAVGTEITFSGGNLIATNTATGQSATIALTALKCMYFSTESITTGIDDTDDSRTTQAAVTTNAGRIYVAAEAGTRVTVVNVAGAVVAETTLATSAATAVTPVMQRGVYVVIVNNTATKIALK